MTFAPRIIRRQGQDTRAHSSWPSPGPPGTTNKVTGDVGPLGAWGDELTCQVGQHRSGGVGAGDSDTLELQGRDDLAGPGGVPPAPVGFEPGIDSCPDGRGTIYSCVSTATKEDEGKVRTESCDFGLGSSGGPWLYRYNESTGLGYVRSVTSRWQPRGGVNRGPYFTEAVKTMLDATAGD